jgi:protein phosphatase
MNPNQGFDMPRPIEKARVLELKVASATVASEKHRDRNEDSSFHSQRSDGVVIAGVFDGVGGIVGGDRASKTAKEHILANLQQMPSGVRSNEAYAAVQNAFLNADAAVRQLGGSGEGPATTASVLVICESSTRQGQLEAIPCNVGDSRIYRLRGGVLEQITLDDSSVRHGKTEAEATVLQDKLSRAKSLNDPSLSVEDKFYLRTRNVVDQALGVGSEITPRMPARPIEVNAGDKFVILSDGISDNLTTDEIQGFLTAEDVRNNPQLAIDRMKEASLKRSREPRSDDNFRPKADDMTGIIVDVGGLEQKGYATPKLTISSAETEQQLVDVLMGIGGLQGSQGFHESAELITQVQKVMAGEAPITSLTRTDGLRDRVAGLLGLKGQEQSRQVSEVNASRGSVAEKVDPVRQTIGSATTEQELSDAIRRIGGLQGSQEFYSSEQLGAQIKQVMAGEVPLTSLTRTGGLRDKVADLMALRQVRGQLR